MALTRLQPFNLSTTASYEFGNLSLSGNILSVSANLGNSATANFFIGSGNNLSNIQGANVSGAVATANVAGTVSGNNQSNITSLGTLTGLTVSGTTDLGSVTNVKITGGTANYVLSTDGAGNLSWVAQTGGGSTSNISNGSSNVSIPSANGNVTVSVDGTANVLTISNTAANFAGIFTANGLSASSLAISGDATISGNLNVDGNLVYIDVTDLAIEDSIIQLQRGPNGAAPTSNTGKDVGTALNYYDTAARVAFMGWNASNAEFGFGANVTLTNDIVTSWTYGNIRTGNATLGNLASANFLQGTLTTASQPNITSVGTLGSLAVTGNITAGNANLGNAASANFFVGDGSLLTNISTSTSIISNGNSNVSIPAANGNVNISAAGTANVLTVSGSLIKTAANIIPAANVTYDLGSNTARFKDIWLSNSTIHLGTSLISGPSENAFFTFSALGAQAGITTVFEISANSVTIPGNVVSNTGNFNGNVTANYFIGNGSLLTGISGGNSISEGNSNVRILSLNGFVTTSVNGNANVLVVSDTGANVTGTFNVGGNANAGNIGATGGVFTTVAGSLTTAAQPNITSVGTLGSLAVTGNITAGNANLGNVVTANFFVGDGYLLSNVSAYSIANGNSNVSIPAANGNINFSPSGNANMLIVTGNGAILNGNLSTGNGTGGNISGANVISANTFTGVFANGTSDIAIPAANGNINFDVAGNSNVVVMTGSGVNVAGTLTVTASANLGNSVAANFFVGDGGLLTNITSSSNAIVNGNSNVSIPSANGNVNVSAEGNANVLVITGTGANVAGTLNATGNLTSGGNLSVTGNAIITGNLTVDGNLIYVNVTDLSVEDPIIQLQTGPNGAPPTSNSGKDVGTALNYYDTSAKIAWMGWDTSAAEIAFGANVGISSEVVTFTELANIRAGNAQLGNLANANFVQGTLTTAAQPNITSVGTLGSLDVTGNVTAGNFVTSGSAGNISGANVITACTFVGNTGNFSTALNVTGVSNLGPIGNVIITGGSNGQVLTTNGSGNLSWTTISTSSISNGNSNVSVPAANGNVNISAAGNANILVVTGSGIQVAGQSNLGPVANVVITGGSNGQVLTTDGNGVLSWTTAAGGGGGASISNGNSNVNIATANGNITMSVAGNANIVTVTGAGANITGDLGVVGNVTANNFITSGNAGNISGANVITACTFIGNTGNFSTALNVTGVSNLGPVGNVTITGGSNGQYLQTNGSGVLSWSSISLNTISNGNSNVSVPAANGNVNISAAGNANILVVSGTGANVAGTLNATGNLIAANASLGNLASANFLAGTLTTAAQPNITSIGTLGSLAVTGNITAGNANLGNAVTANFYIGDGGLLTNISVSTSIISNGNSNVSIPSANGNVNISAAGNANIVVITGTGANISGTVNITGNLAVGGQANLGNVGNVRITGGTANYVLSTDGAGNLSWVAQTGGGGGNGTPGGTNTQVQFNDANSFAGNAGFTFDKTTTTVTANNFVATSTANLGAVGNVVITGGTNGQILVTDGAGGLNWGNVGTAVTVDDFMGSGSQTAFTLSTIPAGVDYTLVSIAGTFQPRTAYNLAGNVLTFTSAPPAAAEIEVTTLAAATYAGPNTGTFINRSYTGNGVQNTFTVTNGVTANSVIVTENGVVQEPGTDYTISGATLTFTSAPANTTAIAIREIPAGGPGGSTYSSASANLNAVANTKYILNTSSANIVVTLPGSPSFGMEVGVIDGTGNANTNAITVYGNGANIQGSNSNMTVNTSRAAFTLVYYNAAQGWLLTNV